MLRRLLVGLFIGLVIGSVMAVVLVRGLAMPVFAAGGGGAVLAYVFAALTGALTGLIAGKPIWAKGGQIEAGLKALFGALLASGGMFALRKWATPEVDLASINAGVGALGTLPATTLPILAAILGGLFELDNTGNDEPKAGQKGGGDLAGKNGERTSSKSRVAVDSSESEEDEIELPSRKAKR
jgi:hypothetical protein